MQLGPRRLLETVLWVSSVGSNHRMDDTDPGDFGYIRTDPLLNCCTVSEDRLSPP